MKINFKSAETDFTLIINKQLDYLLNEQRAQRQDLATILRILNKQLNDSKLQKQVDQYFEDDTKDIPEDA